MKFIHLSDLHIGKRLNEYSLLQDQKYILAKIINIIDNEKPDGVIIAGDVYDKSTPSAESVQVFDEFLYKLSKRKLNTFVLSGNHDSAERIAFASRIMDMSGIHMSPVYNGEIHPIVLEDDFGSINIYMLPFVKPVHVRKFYPDSKIESYNDAVKKVISEINIDDNKRNLLITHQFVTGASRCESEDISVGGTDNIDANIFYSFDYVALGHIHSPQSVLRETIRYCGTPLKYSFSEANQEKSVTVVELFEKNKVNINTAALVPKRDMRVIKGNYDQVTVRDFYKDQNTDDYLYITLTDEEDLPDAISRLRTIYPNVMKLDYDNIRTRKSINISSSENVELKSPLDLFSELYVLQNNQDMSEQQQSFTSGLIKDIWEDEE